MRLGKTYEINKRIIQDCARKFIRSLHPAIVSNIGFGHRIIAVIVGNNRKNRNLISGHRPKPRSRVHRGPVADIQLIGNSFFRGAVIIAPCDESPRLTTLEIYVRPRNGVNHLSGRHL